jgi:hypothetical protein
VQCAVCAARHRHGLPALEASESGCTSLDLSIVLGADTHAVRTTYPQRVVALWRPRLPQGVDLATGLGVGLLDSSLRPVRNRDELGNHTANGPAVWTVLHVLGPEADSAAAAAVFGAAWVLLITAAAGHADVPDRRLIAPTAPEGLGDHGAVCGSGHPTVQQPYPRCPGVAVIFRTRRALAAGEQRSRNGLFAVPGVTSR